MPSNAPFEISLRKDVVALCDESDAELLLRHRWYLIQGRPRRYALAYIDGKRVLMHRLLMPDVPEIDHRNRDGLDNRRQNLRACTHSQNMANAEYRPGISGYRGVTQNHKRWRAQINVNKKRYTVGTYDTPEEAARAYDAAARAAFGEFAYQNFPQS